MPLTELTIEDALAVRLIQLAFAISDKGCKPDCKCELCFEFSSTMDDYIAVTDDDGGKKMADPIIKWPVFCGAKVGRSFWFRIFGIGLNVIDHREQRPLWSERNGYVRVLHVGNKCFRLLAR